MRILLITAFICLTIFGIVFWTYSYFHKAELESVEREIRRSKNYLDAVSTFESGDFDPAISVIVSILNRHPDQDWLRLELGDMYTDVKKYDKALECYHSIHAPKKLQLGNNQLYLRIGNLFAEIGKNDSALFYFRKILNSKSEEKDALGYDHTYQSAYGNIGAVQFSQGKYEEAIKSLSAAIAVDKIPKDLYIRANAYYFLKKYDSARMDYTESIKKMRQIYINQNPKYKDILCDTCGPHFGEPEYMDVLIEWRSIPEQALQRKESMEKIEASSIYKIMVDSIPRWDNEIDSLENKREYASRRRRRALQDSVAKYSDTTFSINMYD